MDAAGENQRGGRTLAVVPRWSGQRNPGMPLQLDWINEVRVNLSAVERRVATLVNRRSIKNAWQVAWLLRAVTCIDLTTLSGDDTADRVRRLCAKARAPVSRDLLVQLGVGDIDLRVASVCVYHAFVETAVAALAGSDMPVAAVSAGFPAGLSPLGERVAEIRRSVAAGAGEIDIVITRAHVLGGRWQALHDEVAAFREACGEVPMKAILATGELGTLRDVLRASLVCMMAGADFIKTSTGKEAVNATLPVGLVMARAIRGYGEQTGYRVGLKAAGGVRTARQALDWLVLMREELGRPWQTAELFRIGASGLLGDIERQLEHAATGNYSAGFRHPLG
jgi:deoxyribose-phosphate aldolase